MADWETGEPAGCLDDDEEVATLVNRTSAGRCLPSRGGFAATACLRYTGQN